MRMIEDVKDWGREGLWLRKMIEDGTNEDDGQDDGEEDDGQDGNDDGGWGLWMIVILY